jgi:hypothetical protein
VRGLKPLGPCPLCGRDLVPGPSINKHHFVPKSRGGRQTNHLHRICHSKIHSLFTEREIERLYSEPEALLQHPEIQKFVRWLARKDPEYVDRNERAKTKKGR